MSLFEESGSVNVSTGEILACQTCEEKERMLEDAADIIKGLEGKIKGLILQVAELKRNREAEMEEAKEYPIALALFAYWRKKTGRRGNFSLDRFELVLPYLKKDGPELCARAICGIAYDHYVKPNRNGKEEHYNTWEKCFEDRGHFERFCRKAPLVNGTWQSDFELPTKEKK